MGWIPDALPHITTTEYKGGVGTVGYNETQSEDNYILFSIPQMNMIYKDY